MNVALLSVPYVALAADASYADLSAVVVDIAMTDKRPTYSVEGDNAQLRHYLARRSRSIRALERAVKRFVPAWNRPQLYQQRYPAYPAHVLDFAYP